MALTPKHLKRALEDEEFARNWTNRLVKELNESGHSWSELAEATGLTVSALRWRAGQARGLSPAAEQQDETANDESALVVEQQGAKPKRTRAKRPTLAPAVQVDEPDTEPTLAPPVALSKFMRGDRWRSLDAAGAKALLDELTKEQLAFSVPSAPSTSAILTALTETSDQLRAHGFYRGGWVIADEVVVISRKTTRQLTEQFTLDGHVPTVERRGKEFLVRWPS